MYFHLLRSPIVCVHVCASSFAGKVAFCHCCFKILTTCTGPSRGSRGSGLVAQVLRRWGVLGFGWPTRAVWLSVDLISAPVLNVPVTSQGWESNHPEVLGCSETKDREERQARSLLEVLNETGTRCLIASPGSQKCNRSYLKGE